MNNYTINHYIDLSHDFVYILWWVGIWGVIETLISIFKVNQQKKLFVYIAIILLSVILMNVLNISIK